MLAGLPWWNPAKKFLQGLSVELTSLNCSLLCKVLNLYGLKELLDAAFGTKRVGTCRQALLWKEGEQMGQ